MKTAISIANDVFAEAERVARKLEISRSELYARALRAYLRQFEGDAIRRRIDAVLASAPPPLLDRALARMQALSLGADEGPLEDWWDTARLPGPARGRRARRAKRA